MVSTASYLVQTGVAPRAGAWIETFSDNRWLTSVDRRPPRGGVD